MSLATQIKPISYLKSNAADIVKGFAVNPEPLIITQNGEAKMAVVEINQYEKQQEQLALLRLIALGRKEYQAGNITEADAFFKEMDKEE
ncbi:MAG: type II toxin-antitoxin system Phd/YefM family antitoxin [Proteobacteria bacterium]|nr:type II toxin-antitoxin system Phd/YefM family antitoxin [Pseudomonadota bacterium]MCL2306647.1 type II toxin-antitoxin system Phd/YefM family antitoxin [Pseudomonadota bacterium]